MQIFRAPSARDVIPSEKQFGKKNPKNLGKGV